MQKTTPLLKQYFQVKSKYEDCVLLFRMGDFYETFFKDAEIASKVLSIALTSRSHGKGNRVPLAGIPIKAADNYINKLIKAGYKVAICEQLEEASQAKGLVKRDVVEVITPGTITNPNILDSEKNTFLAALNTDKKGNYGLSYCDISTGDFYIQELTEEEIINELKKIEPGELLISEELEKNGLDDFFITTLPHMEFQYDYAVEKLKRHFHVETISGFGIQNLNLGIGAAGAILSYLDATQKRTITHIKKVKRSELDDNLVLDSPTIRNLELTQRFDGSTEPTLFSILKETRTLMGTRLLRRILLKPLRNLTVVQERLDSVDLLIDKEHIIKSVRKTLNSISDIERLMGRIGTERANARDLISLKNSLEKIPELKDKLSNLKPSLIQKLGDDISDHKTVIKSIGDAIVEEPPLTIKEGGIIKRGFSEKLDKLVKVVSQGKKWIANLEKEEKKRTGISSLKVRYNSVFGYYIEVTKPNLKYVPHDYIRKQTLTNCERFITPELKEYENSVLGSEEKIKKLEYNIFCDIRTSVSENIEDIQKTAEAIALIDLIFCFAFLAKRNRYTKPVVNNLDEIAIEDGRHPVVEKMLEKGSFIPNNTYLNNDDSQILIITGPNMSGKSTYLRQTALICIMAQMGCFVPAGKAKIGLVDRIFTRIGASDDLSRGVSTFLAEMTETANILNNATGKSLVILDEVGRGTSTLDGLSIAWSVCEFLHNNPRVHPKTLFATHFHELTELEKILHGIKNYNVSVKRWKDEIIFLRKVNPGTADDSYGVDVAKLAGLPPEVIKRAKEILDDLEEEDRKYSSRRKKRIQQKNRTVKGEQLSLFNQKNIDITKELETVDISSLTPLEALNLLNKWKKELKE
jgi:DNA mismatch repair protein MutS